MSISENTQRDMLEGKITKEDLILANTEKINVTLSDLSNRLYKIIYAVLGLLGASIGLKFVGTPWYVDMFVFASLTAAIFVMAFTITNWKCMTKLQRFFRVSFGMFTIFSSAVHICIYQPGVEASPTWFAPTIDVFLTLLCILFIITTWRTKINKGCLDKTKISD